jgi:hypothetical protein
MRWPIHNTRLLASINDALCDKRIQKKELRLG